MRSFMEQNLARRFPAKFPLAVTIVENLSQQIFSTREVCLIPISHFLINKISLIWKYSTQANHLLVFCASRLLPFSRTKIIFHLANSSFLETGTCARVLNDTNGLWSNHFDTVSTSFSFCFDTVYRSSRYPGASSSKPKVALLFRI